MNSFDKDFYSILGRAYIRDDRIVYEDEAVLLASLLHTKGNKSKDLEDLWRIMRDHNH